VQAKIFGHSLPRNMKGISKEENRTVGICKVDREVVGGPRGPIVIIVEVIQCKVD
jgi:hypothetical protein